MIKYYCDKCGEDMGSENKGKTNVGVQFDGFTDFEPAFRGKIYYRLYCNKCKSELAAFIGVHDSAEDGNAVR